MRSIRLRRLMAWVMLRLKLAARADYINGSEALPPPLTRQEEAALLRLLGEGDKSVRRVLIERNLRLVVYIARKFENTGIGIEDLVSIGAIGLIKAVNTFDVDKNIKLATYASRCIENEILMYLRRNAKLRCEVSNELLLSDILGTEPDVVYTEIEDGVEKDLMQSCIDKLCAREKMIMEMRFGLNGQKEQTQKQVADKLGISQSYISRLEKRIIKQLRSEISKIV